MVAHGARSLFVKLLDMKMWDGFFKITISVIWSGQRKNLLSFTTALGFSGSTVVVVTIDLIWDEGGQEKKLWGQALLLLFSPSKDFLCEGGKPPLPKVWMPSQTPIHLGKGEKAQCKKRGGRVHPPPLTHTFACFILSSPPKQRKKFVTRSFELLVVARRH